MLENNYSRLLMLRLKCNVSNIKPLKCLKWLLGNFNVLSVLVNVLCASGKSNSLLITQNRNRLLYLRFRHVSAQAYELELTEGISTNYERDSTDDYQRQMSVGSHENFDKERSHKRSADRYDDESTEKRRRRNDLSEDREVQMLRRENAILKQQLRDLKKQVIDKVLHIFKTCIPMKTKLLQCPSYI